MNIQKENKRKQLIIVFGSKPAVFWILLTLPGWILTWITGSSLVADFAALFGSFILARWVWAIIGRPFEMVRFLRFGAVVLCILQNLSWVTASGLHRFVLHIPIENSFRMLGGKGLQVSSYAAALVFITLFSAFLSYLSSKRAIYRKEKKIVYILFQLTKVHIWKINLFLGGLILIELYLIGSGVIGQRSIVLEGIKEGEQTFSMTLFQAILPVQMLFCALLLNVLIKSKPWFKFKFSWLVFIVSVAMFLFLYFNKGRRDLFFSILAFGYFLSFFGQSKPRLWKLAFVGVIIYPMLSQALLFSNFIRSPNSGVADWQGSAIEVLPMAWERFKSSSNFLEEEKSTTSNLSTRPLVASPLAMSIELPMERKSFTMGENLFNSLVWAIPGPLFPNKQDYPVQETLMYKHFPIGETDTADSIYLAAYLEFGWVGAIIFPILLLLLWMLVGTMIFFLRKIPMIAAIIIALFLQLFLLNIGEGALGGWLITLRSAIFLFIVGQVWIFFFHPRARNLRMRVTRAKIIR